MKPDLRFSQGFTIIELMIVVSIIAVLTAIAVPSYTRYVENSRCSQAEADLLEIAQWMERRYSTSFSFLDTASQPDLEAAGFDRSPQNDGDPKAFDISFDGNVTQTAYVLEAAPTSLVQSQCNALYIDETGRRWTLDDDGNEVEGW